MHISPQDKQTLRELAKRYAQLAALPQQRERYQRGRDINDLKPRRPMVWLDEIPWHEMDIDGNLTLTCQDGFARQMEWFFRTTLYRWEYIQGDMFVDDVFYISKSYSETGMGVEVNEDIISMDDSNHIISHMYKDQLDSMQKVESLHEPVVTAHPQEDAKKVDWANEILDGILPVKLRGYYTYFAPWDQIPRFRGVTNVLTDLIADPELMHATMKKFTDFGLSTMRQMEKLGLLDTRIPSLHCTPPFVSDFKDAPQPVTMKNSWLRCMAQLFTDVSPSMWKEYELDYIMPLTREFGLVYYGCCEALDHKIPLLKTIPNLRKIGISPWANPEFCAEQIGGDYVYAHKPNPAFVSGTFNPDAVRNEIKRVIEACHKHNCPYEFVIKDISTVTYKPQNLIQWAQTVKQTIDEYYM